MKSETQYEIQIIWVNGNQDTKTRKTISEARKEVKNTFETFGKV